MQANQARNKPLHSKPVNISLEVEVINLIFVWLSVWFKSNVDNSLLLPGAPQTDWDFSPRPPLNSQFWKVGT